MEDYRLEIVLSIFKDLCLQSKNNYQKLWFTLNKKQEKTFHIFSYYN